MFYEATSIHGGISHGQSHRLVCNFQILEFDVHLWPSSSSGFSVVGLKKDEDEFRILL
jgi:hypothetical protein